MSHTDARIAVLVASKGRSDTLRNLIPFLNAQTLRPVSVILSVTAPEDAAFDVEALLAPGIAGCRILSSPGLPAQRNAALAQVGEDIDHVVFFDDDFYPSRFALEALALGFAAYPDVAGITGALIADGIKGPGLTLAAAQEMLDTHDAAHRPDPARPPRILRDTFGLYGCNMAVRRAAMAGLRFDERLPVYGWLEDVDLGAQLPGRRVKMELFTGVHLGTKSGRETAGSRLGYSQMVNPWYLCRKGTLTPRFAAEIMCQNLAANIVKSLKPEPWVDRKARLRGNLIGLRDVISGRAAPERILDWPYA